jgi:hypothetical protein
MKFLSKEKVKQSCQPQTNSNNKHQAFAWPLG